MEVDDSLVDPHLVCVPGLGSLTTGGLASSNLQDFSRHTNRTLHFQFRFSGTTYQIPTHCDGSTQWSAMPTSKQHLTFLQTLHIAASECNPDLVDLGLGLRGTIFFVARLEIVPH